MTENRKTDRYRISNTEIRKILRDATKIYNKYRSPEANAKILRIEDEIFIVRFDGSFCETCGINDWIDDFRYQLMSMGINTEIKEIIEVDESSRIAVFRIKSFENN